MDTCAEAFTYQLLLDDCVQRANINYPQSYDNKNPFQIKVLNDSDSEGLMYSEVSSEINDNSSFEDSFDEHLCSMDHERYLKNFESEDEGYSNKRRYINPKILKAAINNKHYARLEKKLGRLISKKFSTSSN